MKLVKESLEGNDITYLLTGDSLITVDHTKYHLQEEYTEKGETKRFRVVEVDKK